MDRMRIIDKQGNLRYVIADDNSVEEVAHDHVMVNDCRSIERCKYCRRTRAELQQSDRSHNQ